MSATLTAQWEQLKDVEHATKIGLGGQDLLVEERLTDSISVVHGLRLPETTHNPAGCPWILQVLQKTRRGCGY